jgi:hypothetical protein
MAPVTTDSINFIDNTKESGALAYYRGPVYLADFEIIPISYPNLPILRKKTGPL